MTESERERERRRWTGREGSEKHVYLLWVGRAGFPSGELPKVGICSQRWRGREDAVVDGTALLEGDVLPLVELTSRS